MSISAGGRISFTVQMKEEKLNVNIEAYSKIGRLTVTAIDKKEYLYRAEDSKTAFTFQVKRTGIKVLEKTPGASIITMSDNLCVGNIFIRYIIIDLSEQYKSNILPNRSSNTNIAGLSRLLGASEPSSKITSTTMVQARNIKVGGNYIGGAYSTNGNAMVVSDNIYVGGDYNGSTYSTKSIEIPTQENVPTKRPEINDHTNNTVKRIVLDKLTISTVGEAPNWKVENYNKDDTGKTWIIYYCNVMVMVSLNGYAFDITSRYLRSGIGDTMTCTVTVSGDTTNYGHSASLPRCILLGEAEDKHLVISW